MIILLINLFSPPSNDLNFKRHQVHDDDKIEWNQGGGKWHKTIGMSKDMRFYDIKGIYEIVLYLVEFHFFLKCYYC